MSTRTWRALLAVGMAIAAGGGLAACGGGSSDDGASATTAAPADDGAGTETTAASNSDGGDTTAPVDTTAAPAGDQPGCDEIEGIVTEIEGADPTSTNDIGGVCEFRFGENSDWPGYSILWNYGAVDRTQFESMRDMLTTGEMEQVDGPGTEFWVGTDAASSSTHAYVWVEGAGTWDLTYLQPFQTEPQPGDVDKLKALGEQLTS